jgi:hypothetical protein
MTTDDPRCTWVNKSRIALAKQLFIRRIFYGSKLGLKLRKKLVKCYIWSIALVPRLGCVGLDQKYLESFEVWCWRRMEKISWTNHVRNEEVLQRVKKEG